MTDRAVLSAIFVRGATFTLQHFDASVEGAAKLGVCLVVSVENANLRLVRLLSEVALNAHHDLHQSVCRVRVSVLATDFL